MTGQQTFVAIVLRDMKPENVFLESSRRERLTREELEAERGERTARACLCGPGESCFCQLVTASARTSEPQNAGPSEAGQAKSLRGSDN